MDCCSADPSEPPARVSDERGSRWRRVGSVGAAVGVALLPKCPACWSAYAGLSSLLGLSFVVESRYLLPLTSALLAVAVGALWLSARRRRDVRALWLASAAAGATLVGKFVIESDVVLYVGLGSLLLASVWSSCRWSWCAPRRGLAPSLGNPPRGSAVSAQN